MVEYETTVGGYALSPQKIRFTRTVDFYTLGEFAITLPEVDSHLALDQTVEIKRDGTVAFRGKVETLTTTETGTEQGTQFILSGRDMRLLLLRRITGRQIWTATEPATIMTALNSPNYLMATQPSVFTLNPDQCTYIDSAHPDTAYDHETFIRTTNPKFDATRECRIFVRFPLDAWRSRFEFVTVGNLVLKVKAANTCGHKYYVPDQDWTPAVTWNTQPSHGTYIGEVGISAGDEETWKGISANGMVFDNHFDRGFIIESHLTGYELDRTVDYYSMNVAADSRPKYTITPTYLEGVTSTCTASLDNTNAWKVLDNDFSSYWDSGIDQAVGQWFQVDMGESKSISRIIISMVTPDFAKNYKVEYSTGGGWTEITSKTNSTSETIDLSFAAVTARYVKITITAVDTAHWKISEIFIYSPGADILSLGTIDTFGTTINFRVDYERRLKAMARLADSIGWEAWVALADTLNFGPEQGSNKAETVEFEVGRNIFITTRKESMLTQAKSILVLGQGEGSSQIRALKTSGLALPEDVYDFKDLISNNALSYVAEFLLAQLENPTVDLEATVKDDYATGTWDVGDYVRVSAADGSHLDFRVWKVTREYTPESGEDVVVSFGNKPVCLPNILQTMLKNIDKWIKIDQATSARTVAE